MESRGPEVAPLYAWSGVCMEKGDQRLLPSVPGQVSVWRAGD